MPPRKRAATNDMANSPAEAAVKPATKRAARPATKRATKPASKPVEEISSVVEQVEKKSETDIVLIPNQSAEILESNVELVSDQEDDQATPNEDRTHISFLASEVLNFRWGTAEHEQRSRLTAAGYDADAVLLEAKKREVANSDNSS